MTWASRAPATLDALANLWKTVPGLTDIVHDGPLALNTPDLEGLAVGFEAPEGVSLSGDISPDGFDVRPDREQFTVNCLILVINGAGHIKVARDRAYQILGLAVESLTEDHRLGGLVMRAHVQDVVLGQQQTNRGAVVQIAFTVACDAFTQR